MAIPTLDYATAGAVAPRSLLPSPEANAWALRTIRRFWFLLAGVTSLFLATEAVGLSGAVPALRPVSFGEISGNILFAIGFGSPLILYVSSLPGWRSLARTAAGAVVLILLLWAAHRQIGPPQVVTGLGLASMAALGVVTLRGRGPARTAARLYLLPAAVSLVFTFEAGIFFDLISSVFPRTFDPLAYAADAGYGFQPAFAVGRWFVAYPVLRWVCFVIYVAPPPALVFVYALQTRAARPPPVDVVTVLLAAALLGYAAYFIFPICGPLAAFGGAFPDAPPLPGTLTFPRMFVPLAPRNGMPSLHMASVVLAYWHARPYGWIARATAAVFVAGTFLATLGLGEHYFVDLVVALPFTLAVLAACTPDGRGWRGPRVAALLGAGGLVVGWYVLLFVGTPILSRSPGLTWGTTVVTAAVVFLLERHLYRAGIRADGLVVRSLPVPDPIAPDHSATAARVPADRTG